MRGMVRKTRSGAGAGSEQDKLDWVDEVARLAALDRLAFENLVAEARVMADRSAK